MKVLEDNGNETRFQLGNHSGIAFNPDQFHQLFVCAKDSSPKLSARFIEGAQDIHVMPFDSSPNPSSYLLAGNRYMEKLGHLQNLGAMGAMLSRCSSMLYTDFGYDYMCLVSRNGNIIYRTRADYPRYFRLLLRHKAAVY